MNAPLCASLIALMLFLGCQPATAPQNKSSAAPAATAPASTPSQSPAALAAQASPSALPAPLSPPVAVRAGVLGLAGDAGIFIGQERGYFEQEGIAVEVTILGAGPDAIPLLASGQLEVGGPTPDASLLNAISRDVPIKIVADKGRYLSDRPTSAAFVVRKDLLDAGTIQSVPDLQGRRVGVVAAQS